MVNAFTEADRGPSESAKERVLTIVPTFNEAASIVRVVEGILAACESDVLIVDDSSPDGTGEIAERMAASFNRVHVMHRRAKQGLGSAYRDGMRWGLTQDYTTLCEMDADLSHDPVALPVIIESLDRAGLSTGLSIGSRYVPGGAIVGWPAHRRWLSRWGNWYARVCTGLPVRDATAGFRAYRREVFDDVDLSSVRSEGYSFQLEMAVKVWHAGFAIVEVPIVFRERRDGASKMRWAIVVEALWRTAMLGWKGRNLRGAIARRADSGL